VSISTSLEASMAEGYTQNECLGFITEYLQRFDVVKRRIWDANEEKEMMVRC
jgi:hypothetical protein